MRGLKLSLLLALVVLPAALLAALCLAATPAAAAKPGGTLTMATSIDVPSLEPHLESADAWHRRKALIYENLTWVDNEHADDKTVAVPKITARLLDPEKDKAIVDRLSEDSVGPAELFTDPCWLERAHLGSRAHDPRCHTDLPHGQGPHLTAARPRTIKRPK